MSKSYSFVDGVLVDVATAGSDVVSAIFSVSAAVVDSGTAKGMYVPSSWKNYAKCRKSLRRTFISGRFCFVF